MYGSRTGQYRPRRFCLFRIQRLRVTLPIQRFLKTRSVTAQGGPLVAIAALSRHLAMRRYWFTNVLRLGLSSMSLSGIVLCQFQNGHLPHGLALCRTVGIEPVSASFCLRFVYWLMVLLLSSSLFAIMRRFSLLNTHRVGARLAGYKLVLRIAIVFAARSQLRC